MATTKKHRIRVVAALVQHGDRYLITQRRADASLPLKWEFPGGRAEAHEEDESALLRELEERLRIDVEVGRRFLKVDHEYPDYIVDFRVYQCTLRAMRPEDVTPVRVNAVRWVTSGEFDQYEFPGADQSSADVLLRGD